MEHVIVGMSGASGAILGLRIAKILSEQKILTHLILTDAVRLVLRDELVMKSADDQEVVDWFPRKCKKFLLFHNVHDIGASIASGSFVTRGMIIAPCSMATLAAVSLGFADNLLRRAADVCLKEKRQLVVLPREMPFSLLHLEHMCALSRYGAIIMPPQPAWYLRPNTVIDIEENIAIRAVRGLGVDIPLSQWKGGVEP
jgi:polyprenyl P-hydroxybenzoate/phenylacrylic acid decarboxylase-like protein